MSHLVVGAGPVGSALARLLADRGDAVTVVTRSGGGPDHPGIRRVAADAADADRLADLARGAATVVNCANPGTYAEWEARWPPLAAALLAAAERSGAVLVTTGNLYGYGPVDVPMTPDLPLAATGHKGRLRARMWQDALAAHEAGRVRATEVRAADYIGPTVTAAGGLLRRYADAALRGRTARTFGDPDVPHAFSFVPDVARTLAAVAGDERAWGRAWHVPGAPERTVREVLTDLVTAADAVSAAGPGTAAPAPRVRRVPRPLLAAGARVVPVLRELDEVLWQFDRPFRLDASATTATFGLHPTPWPEVVAATAAGWSPAARSPRAARAPRLA
ncbi:NAD-dependent epimerase/dehydratase family protein [Cellulomonas hominis]|uniref:NAD-dependent epimerase/dehydratase family protein n=1 Tax=Cellulomonas hominis TaxID=156981 RepID=UPI001443A75E|nr:NAD-dependent epimerase/dehydratase family protein [Cellulomonas hominis]